jgi:hypothetical protein
MSRLLSSAAFGGPVLHVPALCVAAAAAQRPAIGDHLADLLADARHDAIGISGLLRSEQMDLLRRAFPRMPWPATHAALTAQTTDLPLVTVDGSAYVRVPIAVVLL